MEHRKGKEGAEEIKHDKKAKSFLGWAIFIGVGAIVILIFVVGVYPALKEQMTSGESQPVVVVQSTPQTMPQFMEKKVIPLLGIGRRSEVAFDFNWRKIPEGTPCIFIGAAESQVHFADGTSGPIGGKYPPARGPARFSGVEGDTVTVCCGTKCDYEEHRRGWLKTPQSIEAGKKSSSAEVTAKEGPREGYPLQEMPGALSQDE